MQVPGRPLDRPSLDVLSKDVAGPALSDDAALLGPEVDGDSSPVTRAGEGLAGKGAVEDVHGASPGPAVELSHVGEEGEPGQDPICDTLQQDGLAVGSDFDGADGSVPKEEVRKDSATSPCKKMESSEGVQLMGPFTRPSVHRLERTTQGALHASTLRPRRA